MKATATGSPDAAKHFADSIAKERREARQLAKDIRTYMTFHGWASSKKQLRYLRRAEKRLQKFIEQELGV